LTLCARAQARAASNYPFLTQKERDIETGLDYFAAGFYASMHGRFTSVEPLYYSSSRRADPQQFNLYSYVRNNPLRMVDPDGRDGYVLADTPNALDRVNKEIRRIAPGTRIDERLERCLSLAQ
jgi:RHS repeat-associated protein